METHSKYIICVFVLSLATSTFGSAIGLKAGSEIAINPGNGLQRGDWGTESLCFSGSYAHQMEFKYDTYGQTDDTIGNGLKFYCYDAAGNMVSYVTSSIGDNGEWQGIKSCPQNVYINGFSMKVEADKGTFGDDVGVVDIRVTCEDGTVLDGLSTQYLGKIPKFETVVVGKEQRPIQDLLNTIPDNEKADFNKKKEDIKERTHFVGSEWGGLATCPTGYKVCGLQTRVDDLNVFDDDAGLCDVILFCCE